MKSKFKTLTEDDVKDLMCRIEQASTTEELQQLRERCRLVPAYTADVFLNLCATATKRVQGAGIEIGGNAGNA
jgi:hypothetical protein